MQLAGGHTFTATMGGGAGKGVGESCGDVAAQVSVAAAASRPAACTADDGVVGGASHPITPYEAWWSGCGGGCTAAAFTPRTRPGRERERKAGVGTGAGAGESEGEGKR
jgi:hypothetical protein